MLKDCNKSIHYSRWFAGRARGVVRWYVTQNQMTLAHLPSKSSPVMMQHCKINHIKHDMTVSSASFHPHILKIEFSNNAVLAVCRLASSDEALLAEAECSTASWAKLSAYCLQFLAELGAVNTTSSWPGLHGIYPPCRCQCKEEDKRFLFNIIIWAFLGFWGCIQCITWYNILGYTVYDLNKNKNN